MKVKEFLRVVVAVEMAGRERFELSVSCPTHAFQACSLNRSDIYPRIR